MSFILDALNRSDTDRDEDQAVPGLQTVHGPRSAAEVPLWRRALWPALAILFALIAAGAWLGSPGAPESGATQVSAPAEQATPVPTQQAPMEKQAAVPAPQPVAKAVPKPTAGQQADIAALYASKPATPQPALTSPQAAPATPQPAPLPVPASPEPEVVAPQPQPTPRPAQVAQPAIDVEALARAAQAELDTLQDEQAPVVEHEAPFISELRQSQKDQIPSIFYNAHNWSANPSRSSVILNKREFRAGQQVKPGLKLVEILQDGIVLDFRGTEFRLNSLNSWVNL